MLFSCLWTLALFGLAGAIAIGISAGREMRLVIMSYWLALAARYVYDFYLLSQGVK